jgi:hypothetical protein
MGGGGLRGAPANVSQRLPAGSRLDGAVVSVDIAAAGVPPWRSRTAALVLASS